MGLSGCCYPLHLDLARQTVGAEHEEGTVQQQLWAAWTQQHSAPHPGTAPAVAQGGKLLCDLVSMASHNTCSVPNGVPVQVGSPGQLLPSALWGLHCVHGQAILPQHGAQSATMGLNPFGSSGSRAERLLTAVTPAAVRRRLQAAGNTSQAWLTSSRSLSALAFSIDLRRACCSCCICHHSLDCSCCARVRSAMDRSSPSKRCREAGPQRGSSSPNLQQWALSSSCKLWSATARLRSSSPSLQEYGWGLSSSCKHWLQLSRHPAGRSQEHRVLKDSLWS